MKNNLRRITKMKHKINGNEKVLSKDRLNTILKDEKEQIIKEYFNKHYALGRYPIKDKDAVEFKLFKDKVPSPKVYINKNNTYEEAILNSDNQTYYFKIPPLDKKHYRIIETQEKKLLLFKQEIYTELNKLYTEFAKTMALKVQIENKQIDITYDKDKLDALINYLIDLKKNEIFSREKSLFLDEKSLDLYSLLIQSICKRPTEQKFVSFIVKCQENDFDIEKEFKSIFIRATERNIKYSFFGDTSHFRLSKIKEEKNIDLKSKDFFTDYNKASTEILDKFMFNTLYDNIKKIPEKDTYRDAFINDLRAIIKNEYMNFYKKVEVIGTISKNEKDYICKIINDYIKKRTNKILKQYPKNDKIIAKDIKKFKELFDASELKPKVKRALMNKLVYFIKYDYSETPDTKFYNKIKNSLTRKTRTYVNEIIYNLIVKNENTNEVFGAGTYRVFVRSISDKTLNELNEMNSKSLFNTSEFLISLYLLRNFILHYDQGLDKVIESSQLSEGEKNNWSKSIDNLFNKPHLLDKLKSIRKDYLVEKLNSNACYYFYTDDEITKIINELKLNEIKSPILPRFSKVFHHLLKERGIEYKDLDRSFANASSYVLGLVYSHNFSIYINSNFNISVYKRYINKSYPNYDLSNYTSLEECKREMMSECLGNEDKVRKAEKKFVKLVSILFNEYLKFNTEFDVLKNKNSDDKKENNPYIQLDGFEFGEYIKPQDLSIFAKLLVSTIPFLRKGVLAKFKGDLSKYRQAINEVKNKSEYENKTDYLSSADADFLINLIEFQIEDMEKKFADNFKTANVQTEDTKDKLFNNAFLIFNYNNQFKSYKEVKYEQTVYNNDRFEKNQIGLFIAEPKVKSYIKDENYIPFKFILELNEYGHLEKLIHLHKMVMESLKIDINLILKEYGEYKSHINIKNNNIQSLFGKLYTLPLHFSINNIINSNSTLTLIELYTKLRDLYFVELKNVLYSDKDANTGSKKGYERDTVKELNKNDFDKFMSDLKIYNELNKRILRYSFISNLLHLNIVNKSFSIYCELNSRILSWEYDLYPLNKDLQECKINRDFDKYKENNDVLNQVYNIYDIKIEREQYKKIFNNSRHYNLLRNYIKKQGLSNYKNLSSFFIGDYSLENHLSFLTNFRNDVQNVFTSILNKYNLVYENEAIQCPDGSKRNLSSRKHSFLNKDFIKSKIKLTQNQVNGIEDIKLISDDEIAYLDAFIFKVDFTTKTSVLTTK